MGIIYRNCIKRLLDCVLSLLAIILLSPVLLVVSLIVRTKLGTPVLFRQERPGKAGQIFELYKFRTMTDARDAKGNLLPDVRRLPKVGVRLRSMSLDELPELINILKGDMSIVGPRPLLVRYLDRYTSEQARRHEVRPGLTGYAQAYGRNGLTWEEKFKKDVWYVDNVSFLLDCKILLHTVSVVFRREGISEEGSATMHEFMGLTGKGR